MVNKPETNILTRLLPGAGALLIAILGFVPNGPLSSFPPVIVIPLLILAAFAIAGLKFRGSSVMGEILAITILFGGFLILKSIGIRPSRTDENIYFYMAHSLIHGQIPYKDFFFAHPPGHLLFIAPFFVFGFNLVVAKLIPVLITVITGLFIYLTFRRSGYKMAGIVVTFLFLYAYQVLMGSTNLNGENLTVMFLAASVYFAGRGNFVTSGGASGLALSCGLYSLAGVIAMGSAVYSLGKARRLGRLPAGSFWLGVITVVAIVFGGAWFIAGNGFIDGVFKYHMLKPPKSGRVDIFALSNPFLIPGNYLHNLKIFWHGKTLMKSFYFHSPIYLLATGYLIYAISKAIYLWFIAPLAKLRPVVRASNHFDSLDGLAALGIGATILFILQFGALNEVYDFYMSPMLFFTAMPAGVFVTKMLKAPRKYPGWGWLSLLGLIAALWLYLPLSYSASISLWPREHARQGEVVTYEWHDPIAFKSVSNLCKSLFYTDHREQGSVTPFYKHYIWNKSLGLSRINAVASFVRAQAGPGDTLTGASDIAPLVALLSGVRMAGNEADTNSKRFKTGMLTDRRFLRMACKDHLRFVISSVSSHFSAYFMSTSPLYRDSFVRSARFIDREALHHSSAFVIDVYERKGPCPGNI